MTPEARQVVDTEVSRESAHIRGRGDTASEVLPAEFSSPAAAGTGGEELDLEAIRERFERGHGELSRLCREIWAGNRGWQWSIPARPDRDSDLLIGDALADVPKLCAEITRLRTALSQRGASEGWDGVRVRVAVAVNHEGDWHAVGWKIDSDATKEQEAADAFEAYGDGYAVHWLEADLPLPPAPSGDAP